MEEKITCPICHAKFLRVVHPDKECKLAQSHGYFRTVSGHRYCPWCGVKLGGDNEGAEKD
ncbi:unnamed protein product [marine sediment metagenome]|uniref:Uncharacterized protein n=1 Tax=marine sediment metagenome TaxID=412755 RepID=X0UQ64_9ZZZZ